VHILTFISFGEGKRKVGVWRLKRRGKKKKKKRVIQVLWSKLLGAGEKKKGRGRSLREDVGGGRETRPFEEITHKTKEKERLPPLFIEKKEGGDGEGKLGEKGEERSAPLFFLQKGGGEKKNSRLKGKGEILSPRKGGDQVPPPG